jgi:O-acetyl-ADP-ribose deacetylase (regulator of RNase III)
VHSSGAGRLERIECVLGDITHERVDAIVNAANESLRGGGGVDGAIHRAAGPGLLAECIERYPEGCPTGEARWTGAHRLPARGVVHAVGPIYRGGGSREAELLSLCFANSLRLAAEHGARTIAFPAISCGAYGYPAAEAAAVAIDALREGLAHRSGASIERVRLVLFSPELLEVFEKALQRARIPS